MSYPTLTKLTALAQHHEDKGVIAAQFAADTRPDCIRAAVDHLYVAERLQAIIKNAKAKQVTINEAKRNYAQSLSPEEIAKP